MVKFSIKDMEEMMILLPQRHRGTKNFFLQERRKEIFSLGFLRLCGQLIFSACGQIFRHIMDKTV